MNFRNKKLVLTVRILLGLMFVFSGVSGMAAGLTGMEGKIPAPMLTTQMQLWDMGIFQMIKVTEIVAGLMLIFGFLPALALLFLSPICVGVLVYNSTVAPQFLVTGVIVSLATAFLGYAYWEKFKGLFERK
jgi:putative oxidoreductase